MTKLDPRLGDSVRPLRLGLATLALLVPLASCQVAAPEPDVSVESGAAPLVGVGRQLPAEDGPTLTTADGKVCERYEWQPCYYGPPGTEGVGICSGGHQECSYDETHWYECDDTRPEVESCANDVDDDCDGEVNEGCVCQPWDEQACCVGDGPSVVCVPGVRPCASDGFSWGECVPAGRTCAEPAGPSGTFNWDRSLGIDGTTIVRDVVTDGDCGVYITGSFDGTIDLGAGLVAATVAGERDTYFAKYDAGGHHVWSKVFHFPTGSFTMTHLSMDSAGNVLGAGSCSGSFDLGAGPMASAGGTDSFVGKFDADGNLIWGRCLGGAGSDGAVTVSPMPGGDVLVSGGFEGVVDFGVGPMTSAGGKDHFLLRLDSNGNPLWSVSFGNALDNIGPSIAAVVDGAGNIFTAVRFTGSITIGGVTHVSLGSTDLVYMKFDPSGQLLWSRRVGGASHDSGAAVAADAAGNSYWSGGFHGTIDLGAGPITSVGGADVYLLKLDPSGHPLWSRVYGAYGTQEGGQLAIDPQGGLLFWGSWRYAPDFGGGQVVPATIDSHPYLVKLDSDGNHLSTRAYGAGVLIGLSLHPSGNVVMLGRHSDPIDFGGGALPPVPMGTNRGFVASVSP